MKKNRIKVYAKIYSVDENDIREIRINSEEDIARLNKTLMETGDRARSVSIYVEPTISARLLNEMGPVRHEIATWLIADNAHFPMYARKALEVKEFIEALHEHSEPVCVRMRLPVPSGIEKEKFIHFVDDALNAHGLVVQYARENDSVMATLVSSENLMRIAKLPNEIYAHFDDAISDDIKHQMSAFYVHSVIDEDDYITFKGVWRKEARHLPSPAM